MISTDIALSRGFVPEESLEGKRMSLLRDSNYRDSITQGTMKIANIRTRIQESLSFIYNMTLQNE